MPSRPPLGRDDLVFYSATLFERSLEDKLIAAQSGGFAGVGLWASDLAAARASGLSDGDVRQMLASRDLRCAGIDCLFGWAGGENPPSDAAFNMSAGEMIEAAVALGAPAINVAHAFGSAIDAASAPRRLADICALAGAAGLEVTVEPIPWGGIPMINAGRALIAASGATNARLTIDVWHFFRAGWQPADIAKLSPGSLGAIQFCDAAMVAAEDHWADTGDRKLPMEGELAVAELARMLRRIGYSGPFGIECPSAAWAGLDAASIGIRCGDAMRRLRDHLDTA